MAFFLEWLSSQTCCEDQRLMSLWCYPLQQFTGFNKSSRFTNLTLWPYGLCFFPKSEGMRLVGMVIHSILRWYSRRSQTFNTRKTIIPCQEKVVICRFHLIGCLDSSSNDVVPHRSGFLRNVLSKHGECTYAISVKSACQQHWIGLSGLSRCLQQKQNE